jgi:hypothetical protein
MNTPAKAGPKKPFRYYPTSQVIGVIDTAGDAAAARTELDRSGFSPGTAEVTAGPEGLRRLDATGARHGIAGKLWRMLQGYGDMEQQTFARQAVELRAGHSLVGVIARGATERRRAQMILKRHNGHFINFFGYWTIIGMAA